MTKKYYSWEEIDECMEMLSLDIMKSGVNFNKIYGIQRGGLIPAVMLSHILNTPISDIIDSYTLVVDDICDTGETLKFYSEQKCPTATIHYKRSAIIEPTFWREIAEEDIWYCYPWERKDSKTIADYKIYNDTRRKRFNT
jgi:hypoxanthine phosphoribosyltransferase